MPSPRRLSAVAVAVCAAVLVPAAAVADTPESSPPDPPAWVLPWPDAVVAVPYEAPAHRYGPGHRGIDLAAPGAPVVRAPASGMVAFAGRVVDRGVVTVDHGDGWVTSVEPVEASVTVGAVVAPGDVLGALGGGGHTAPGMLHVGVRHEGEYVNPLSLLRGTERAVLLPCC